MKKTNFTFIKNLRRMYLSMFFFSALAFNGTLNAQCSLDCNGQYNVSLGNDCTKVVTLPALITENMDPSNCPDAVSFDIAVFDASGNEIPDATVTQAHLGTNVSYELRALDADGNQLNMCWGYMLVEDKMPPTITCPDGIMEVTCGELENYAPTASDNCGDYTIVGTDISTVVNNCNNGLPDNVIRRITRRYVATDSYGTVSDPCEIVIDVVIPSDPVAYPKNYLFLEDNALQCDGERELDANGHPSPTGINGTGYPTLDGVALYPTGSLACGFIATYSDVVLPPLGCVTKIMRTWTVSSWTCLSLDNPMTAVQMIEIVDEEGPTMECPRSMVATTQGHTCGTVVTILMPTNVSDNCGTVDRITVSNLDGNEFINDLQPGDTHTFDTGAHRIIYRAYDNCGNVTECESYVYVQDNTPPVAVCDENTTVSLTNNGEAWMKAEIFDDGSYDECNLEALVVKRMTNECDCEVPTLKNYTYLGEYEGKFMYLSDREYSFNEALKHAVAYEGNIAIPSNLTKLTWIRDHVFTPANEDFVNEVFIGMGRDHVSRDLMFMDGSSTIALPYNNYEISPLVAFFFDQLVLNGVGLENYFTPYTTGVSMSRNILSNDLPFGIPLNPYLYEVPASNIDFLSSLFMGDNVTDEDALELLIEARYVLELTDVCGFSSHSKFCCEDLGNDDLMVVMRTIDASGNYNECMVNVQVQNKLPLTITCPEDMTRDCGFNYDITDLATEFGEATVTGNCTTSAPIERVVEDFDDCGKGTLTRWFRVGDDSCYQVITFTPVDPFDGDDIDWPSDVTLTTCADPGSSIFDPANTGRPAFIDGTCDLVGASHTDELYRINNPTGEACFKIIRKWVVADWCQYINGEYVRWTYDQVIKVRDTRAPEITSAHDRISTCTYDATCNGGEITLGATATDSCSIDLIWTYHIDLNNDGSFDSGLSVSGTGNVIDASGLYSIGSHRIRYIFEDRCGNQTFEDQLFDIVNCKTPTPYLINGLVMPLMPIDDDNDGTVDRGMAEIWASDFDKGSSHPCGYDVLFSFDPVVFDAAGNLVVNNVWYLDCSDLGVHTDVDIYVAVVTPMGEIIQDYATTTLTIQDNQNICSDGSPMAIVSGNIETVDNVLLPNAEIALIGSEFANQMTSEAGNYAFPSMIVGGAYTVSPAKEDKANNGVSTIDMVMIQRHILGTTKITNPYKLLAADVNKDGSITPLDLLDIRKVILRIKNEFNNNTSWRFVDAGYEFVDETNPFATEIPENYAIDILAGDMVVDFVAIKVGDVNNSVNADLMNISSSSRNQNITTFNAVNSEFNAGETVNLPITSDDNMDLSAIQFTLSFDNSTMEFAGIESNRLVVSDENIGLVYADRGQVTFSWSDIDGVNVNAGEELFTVNFKAINSGEIMNNVSITSIITESELLADEVVSELELNIEARNATEGLFVLNQNTPNPFSELTNITFELPVAASGTFTVVDATGRVVKSINSDFVAGSNNVQVTRNELGATGIFYYTVKAGEYTATKRMVLID